MAYFNETIIGADCAEVHANFAYDLYKTAKPISEEKLRNCTATVLAYEMPDGDTVYLLKSYNTIVAMVDEGGDGIDFLRYVYGYTATSAQHIRKFFADYCEQISDIYIYNNR